MLFSRLLSRKPAAPAKPEDYRQEYRLELPAGKPIQLRLRRSDESLIETEPRDMTVRGVRFRCRADLAPELAVGEPVEAILTAENRHLLITPAVLRWTRPEEGALECGMEFINLGNLYGQWEDYLGQFLNRRAHTRVAPDFEDTLEGALASNGHKMRAMVYDLTVQGVGLLVSHVEAATLQLHEPARVSLRLPNGKEVSGAAILRSRRRLDTRDIVGAEFDLSDPNGLERHRSAIAEYCAKREQSVAQWEASWEEND